MEITAMYCVWHWNRWNFGQWQQAFHGTKEECEKWVKANPGKYTISSTKPTERGPIGKGFYSMY